MWYEKIWDFIFRPYHPAPSPSCFYLHEAWRTCANLADKIFYMFTHINVYQLSHYMEKQRCPHCQRCRFWIKLVSGSCFWLTNTAVGLGSGWGSATCWLGMLLTVLQLCFSIFTKLSLFETALVFYYILFVYDFVMRTKGDKQWLTELLVV